MASDTADPNTANNSASAATAVAASARVTVSAGANPPSSGNAPKGIADVVMAQLAPTNAASENVRLEKITVQASGSGQDAADVTAVKLYLDVNGNGVVDAGETTLAQGTFAANDGALDLALTTPYTLPAGSTAQVIVAYDFSTVLAAALPFAPLAFGLVGTIAAPRLRRAVPRGLAALLVISFVACGGEQLAGQIALARVPIRGDTRSSCKGLEEKGIESQGTIHMEPAGALFIPALAGGSAPAGWTYHSARKGNAWEAEGRYEQADAGERTIATLRLRLEFR